MSKAFTKESDSEDDLDTDASASQLQLPAGSKNYITVAGADRLRHELKHLLNTERPEVVRTVSWAAGNGDRSENGDYIYGKRRLREIDRRIRFLTKRIESAHVVDVTTQDRTKVLFGASVTIENEEGQHKQIRIVGVDEVAPSQGDISWVSPMARALLNHIIGDEITVVTPKGEVDYTIIDIDYK